MGRMEYREPGKEFDQNYSTDSGRLFEHDSVLTYSIHVLEVCRCSVVLRPQM